jgi:hypothetical protein
MDIKLISFQNPTKGFGSNILTLDFTVTVNDIEIHGRAYNRCIKYPQVYILQLVFLNKEVRKHPEYQEIRSKVIQLLCEAKKNTLFSAGVKI